MVDRHIIEACKEKNQQAFRVLYEACLPYVYRVVEGFVKDPDFRRDLIQEIFAKVFLRIHQYEEAKGDFRYWLRKVAANECLMHLREKKRDFHYDLLDLDSMDDYPRTTLDLSHLDPDQSEIILQKMPEGYRQVFSLVELNGYSHEEAGLRLGISQETSRSQLSRAKKWLQNNC